MSTKNEFSKKKGFDLLSTEETEDGKSDDIGIITPSKSKNITSAAEFSAFSNIFGDDPGTANSLL